MFGTTHHTCSRPQRPTTWWTPPVRQRILPTRHPSRPTLAHRRRTRLHQPSSRELRLTVFARPPCASGRANSLSILDRRHTATTGNERLTFPESFALRLSTLLRTRDGFGLVRRLPRQIRSPRLPPDCVQTLHLGIVRGCLPCGSILIPIAPLLDQRGNITISPARALTLPDRVNPSLLREALHLTGSTSLLLRHRNVQSLVNLFIQLGPRLFAASRLSPQPCSILVRLLQGLDRRSAIIL